MKQTQKNGKDRKTCILFKNAILIMQQTLIFHIKTDWSSWGKKWKHGDSHECAIKEQTERFPDDINDILRKEYETPESKDEYDEEV